MQSGDIPVYPSMPAKAPLPLPGTVLVSKPGHAVTGKRRREDDPIVPYSEAVDVSAPKRQAKAHDVLFRIVVPSKQIGKVIGKVGCRIQKVREETKATIKIADAVARYEERVIIISSKDKENTVTDAEIALQQIAALILKEDGTSIEELKVGTGHVAANTIRLLIAGSQAGSLIGASGQNIEKLRNSSGASVTILAPNQLPLCASAHESDRVVQISGDVPAVLKALEEIGNQLRVNPPRQVISVSPTYNYNAIHPPQSYMDPTSVNYVTFEMLISETLVGGLIGIGGFNISRIRNESGATIKVALAKQRVDEYIYSQLMRQAGVQPTAIMDMEGEFVMIFGKMW
ncbi:RNA-binding KH domain-containing protein PEPPER [Cucurbita argyrosperma subsp. argyrosperma]|nr:RNA-binding KH domain-containing protein PEPPER [Cucurbita argyrosperma subsp. argyrosperma]